MALSKADRDFISRTTRESSDALNQISTLMQQLMQEVYGPPPDRNNGLRGDMKDVKSKLDGATLTLNTIQTERKTQTKRMWGTIGTIGAGLVAAIVKLLTK